VRGETFEGEPTLRLRSQPDLVNARTLAPRTSHLAPRRFDRTVAPHQAQRLFDVAGDPKEQRWYSGGHWPPANEVDAAAAWLVTQLSANSYRQSVRG
jgi:hypothetical protein